MTKPKTRDTDRMAAAHAKRMGYTPLGLEAHTTAAQLAEVINTPFPKPAPSLIGPTLDDLIAGVGGKLSVENVRGLIKAECDALCALLLEKNAKYKNSALEPLRLFSKASPVEQILVRVDDKIKRISNMGFEAADEDTTQDLMGYLVLLRVAQRLGLR